jgi:anti-sigma B factor antagonist
MVRVYCLQGDIWAIAPSGRIDTAAARALEDAFKGLFDAGHTRVVVDLAGVSYMASAGLRALMLALRAARTAGGDVQLAALTNSVADTLAMAGLDQLFVFHPSLAEAAAGLKGASAA